MTREEEIIKQVEIYTDDVSNLAEWSDGWEDYNDYEYVKKAFIKGAKWADKTMIEKAKKWLENFLVKTIQKPSINDGYISDTIDLAELTRHRLIEEVLYDFKKAMEE